MIKVRLFSGCELHGFLKGFDANTVTGIDTTESVLCGSYGEHRILALHKFSLNLDLDSVQNCFGLLFDDNRAHLVELEIALIKKTQSQDQQIDVICQIVKDKSQHLFSDKQLSALSASWIHAQNNLLSTLSGYSEILGIDEPDNDLVKQIQKRCKQMSEFTEKNIAFVDNDNIPSSSNVKLESNRDKNEDKELKCQTIEKVKQIISDYLSTEEINECAYQVRKIGVLNLKVIRWNINQFISIKSWDIASIYRAIGQKCHYLIKFELMRLPYYLEKIGGSIQTIESSEENHTLIEVRIPLNTEFISSSKILFISNVVESAYHLASDMTKCGHLVWVLPEDRMQDVASSDSNDKLLKIDSSNVEMLMGINN